MDWYPWNPIAFRRKTFHLSLAEEGAYRRLIDEYMLGREPLPDDDKALARILGISGEEWAVVAPKVREFFCARKGRLHNKRCDEELRAQDMRSERFSERGKKAAYAKYNNPKNLTARRMLNSATLQDRTKKEAFDGKKCKQESKRVRVAIDTPQWVAWTKHLGNTPPYDKDFGWWFPSEWPPGYVSGAP
jgi:uncharacterized protein YdaU (DUF1376 family)